MYYYAGLRCDFDVFRFVYCDNVYVFSDLYGKSTHALGLENIRL